MLAQVRYLVFDHLPTLESDKMFSNKAVLQQHIHVTVLSFTNILKNIEE